jgi:alpha-amylase
VASRQYGTAIHEIRRRAWRILCAWVATVALFTEARSAQAGVLFVANGWRWHDVMAAMPAIKSAGYTAVQISPHSASCAGGYGQGYDPYDFTNFDSGFGSASELQWLVGTAHWYGLHIYADMVMNHMCPRDFRYPRFSWNDFHHNGGIVDWDDPWERENKDLFGLNDLAHESPYVRGELFNFLVKTNYVGFDGYRWDAARHVPHWYWRDHVVNNVRSWGKYNYGEVFSGDLGELGSYVATGMAVTDYALYFALRDAFRFEGDLSRLVGAGYAAVDGANALTFAENHDVGPPRNGLLAYAFLAAYQGYPAFFRPNLGAVEIKNLVWIHEHKARGRVVHRAAERDVLVFEREGNLLAGFNQSGEWQSRWVSTSWNSTRLHDYAGRAGDVWTAGDGRVLLSIPPMSYVMLSPG